MDQVADHHEPSGHHHIFWHKSPSSRHVAGQVADGASPRSSTWTQGAAPAVRKSRPSGEQCRPGSPGMRRALGSAQAAGPPQQAGSPGRSSAGHRPWAVADALVGEAQAVQTGGLSRRWAAVTASAFSGAGPPAQPSMGLQDWHSPRCAGQRCGPNTASWHPGALLTYRPDCPTMPRLPVMPLGAVFPAVVPEHSSERHTTPRRLLLRLQAPRCPRWGEG